MVTFSELQNAIRNSIKDLDFESYDISESLGSEESLNNLDALVQAGMPLELKAFLLEFNGAISKTHNFFAYDNGTLCEVCEFISFFGLYEKEENKKNDLREVYNAYRHFVPSDLMPIAQLSSKSPSDKVLCIGLFPGNYGRIYVCYDMQSHSVSTSHAIGDVSLSKTPWFSNVSFVASSLQDFFLGCQLFGNLYQKKQF